MSLDKEQHSHNGDHTLHLIINEKKYEWHQQYILGAEIRKMASIHEEDEIYLKIKDPWQNELIKDDTKVDLARPRIEHFFSKEVAKQVEILVDGKPRPWSKRSITFKDVIILAYGTYIDKPTMVYTVAYEDGPKQNPEGSMHKDDIVFVKDQMIFHATATDKS